MARTVTFDVYGRFHIVARQDDDGSWALLRRGADGKHSPLTDVVVPDDATLDDVERLLEVAFHEWATPEAGIVRLEG